MVRLNTGKRAIRWAEPNVKFNVDSVNCIYFHKDEHLCQCKECMYFACRCKNATSCQCKKRKEDAVYEFDLSVKPELLEPFVGVKKVSIDTIVVKGVKSRNNKQRNPIESAECPLDDVIYVKIENNKYVLDGKCENLFAAKERGQKQINIVMISKEHRKTIDKILHIGAEIYNKNCGHGIVMSVQNTSMTIRYDTGEVIRTGIYEPVQQGVITEYSQ